MALTGDGNPKNNGQNPSNHEQQIPGQGPASGTRPRRTSTDEWTGMWRQGGPQPARLPEIDLRPPFTAPIFDRELPPRPPPRGRKARESVTFEDIPLEDVRTGQAPQPRLPQRILRSSTYRKSHRLSLTPSEMPYPPGLFSSRDHEGKAETLLSLRPSRAPPVPPKDSKPSTVRYGNSVNCYSTSSSSTSLPLPQSMIETPLPPQNGRLAWLHALAAILVVGNCWGLAQAFGLFQAYYTRYYIPSSSPSTIAWIGSTQLALIFGLGVPVGRLVDKGYFRLMFHGGSAIMCLGILCTSWRSAFWSLWLVQGLLTGTGMGMVFCAGTIALMSWFDETTMGKAMGLGAAGSCLGGILYVLLARTLLPKRGFGTTTRIIAAVATATMIPPNILFRMRTQSHKIAPRTAAPISWISTLRSFASSAYLLAAAGMFCAFLGIYFGFVYIVSFAAAELHLNDTHASNLLIYMLIANLPGRFIPALISDRCIGPLNTIIPSAVLSSGVIFLWLASSTGVSSAMSTGVGRGEGFLIVVACFYGFVSAGVQVLYATTVYTFCLEPIPHTVSVDVMSRQTQQQAMDRMGLKAGGIFSCVGLACLIGTPIGGALVEYRVKRNLGSPYVGAQIFAGAALLLGGGLLLGSRVAKVGWGAKRA
ncbi:hypothetical protein B0A48_07530 [Cryoendolithus antarcticus]|uniref:Major facilitator superfamily (MFS) profile domain-containing protein n=1 Tax=Cryoendolithus antarcticus TaxID=1507870 RepID=A0A1V8T6P4_9PEZI|nr:hypothetical protein B0A48_07530 [Cryoendolithus antarcticus]